LDKINISGKDVLWGYVSQVCNIGAQLFILPALFYFLPGKVLGVWYIFINITSFSVLFGLVFQSSFSRNMSYAFGGAPSLLKEGVDVAPIVSNEPNIPLIKGLIISMKRFYGWGALIMLILLLVPGAPYFHYLSAGMPEQTEITHSWCLNSLGAAVGFYSLYLGSILQGRGYMKEYNQLAIINRLVYVVLVYILISRGYSLWSIAIANLVSSIVNYIAGRLLAYKNNLRSELKRVKAYTGNLTRIVWANTYKLSITTLVIYLSTKGNLFYVSFFLPLDMIAKYGLSLQVVNVLATISLLYYYNYSPLVAQGWVNNDTAVVKRIYTKSLSVCLLAFILGSAGVLLFGDWGLALIRSNTTFLPVMPLALLFFAYLLDTNHTLALNLIISRNKVPHLSASIVSAIAILLFIPVMAVTLGWGIYGVIAAVGLVQLCYQNWKWPLLVSRRLRLGFRDLLGK
jgi:O-antigen/teichoic acid export membrane protein